MRNKILTLTRTSIPYVKELRSITGSIAGAIIMQQLDFWFSQKPDGFYKFMDACPNDLYRPGDSWCEEIGCTRDEFRSAFDKIGTRYTSKTEYVKADDKFKGMLYCSYYDKVKGYTWYFRNHEQVDALLDSLIDAQSTPRDSARLEYPSPGNGKIHLPEMGKSISQRSEYPSPGDWNIHLGKWESPHREMDIPISGDGNIHLESYRDYNRDYTENTQQQQSPPTVEKPPTPVVVVAPSASLIADLVTHGVTKAVAKNLIETHGEPACRAQLDALPLRKCADPAATLVAAIREAWEIPQQKRQKPRTGQRSATRPATPPAATEPTEEQKEAARAAMAIAKKSLGKVLQKSS